MLSKKTVAAGQREIEEPYLKEWKGN